MRPVRGGRLKSRRDSQDRRRALGGRSACVVLLVVAITARAGHGAVLPPLAGLDIDRASGIGIEIAPYFESGPVYGFDAFQVTVRNPTRRPHTWTLVSVSQGSVGGRGGYRTRVVRSTHRLSVDAESERVFDILAPVVNADWPQGVSLRVTGFGVRFGLVHHLATVGTRGFGARPAMLGMSRALAVEAWGPLERDVGPAAFACARFDPEALPGDWRAYAGFADLWMFTREWRALEARSRSTVADWIAQGGRLYLVPEDDAGASLDALGAPGRADGPHRVHGTGSIRLARMNGRDLDTAWAAADRATLSPTAAESFASRYTSWSPVREIGEARMRVGLILSFLVVFAVLVGPVNLFVFCRDPRRQRLFWTTPLISVAASLLLSLVVIFQEGTGGVGARTAAILLLPDENRMIVGQEQVSRTGALLAAVFDAGEPALIEPIELPNVRGARTGSPLDVAGTRRSGRWFSSRSVQAHYVQAARPSRARIEMRPALADGDPPEIVSTVPERLRRIFVVDARGEAWTGEDLEPGVRRRLRRVSEGEREAWDQMLAETTGPRLGGWMKSFIDRPGSFAAWAEPSGPDGNGFAVPTLRSIRWQRDRLLFAGPVVEVQG